MGRSWQQSPLTLRVRVRNETSRDEFFDNPRRPVVANIEHAAYIARATAHLVALVPCLVAQEALGIFDLAHLPSPLLPARDRRARTSSWADSKVPAASRSSNARGTGTMPLSGAAA